MIFYYLQFYNYWYNSIIIINIKSIVKKHRANRIMKGPPHFCYIFLVLPYGY